MVVEENRYAQPGSEVMTKLRTTINVDKEETLSYVSNPRKRIEEHNELISVASIVRKSHL